MVILLPKVALLSYWYIWKFSIKEIHQMAMVSAHLLPITILQSYVLAVYKVTVAQCHLSEVMASQQ